MFFQEFSNKNKEIQNKLLLFLDKEEDIEENFTNLIDLFTRYKILANQHELKSLLYLISNISNNHYQAPCFISKIERLLQYLKEDIKKNFSNLKIFDIFKNSKSTLLILIEQEIMNFDLSILRRISSKKYFNRSYYHFFFPEIQPVIENGPISVSKIDTFNYNDDDNSSDESNDDDDTNYDDNSNDDNDYDIDEDYQDSIYWFYGGKKFEIFYNKFSNKLPDNFLKQRKIGQNENHICKLIREDLISEFITYVNQNNYPLNSQIPKSIYETNSLLTKIKPTLIEYAAFFGSIQIFKYLYLNKVDLKPSLWIYGIHSAHPEIINILEENHIQPKDETYFECIKEAIKCHHNDVANYIRNNYLNEKVYNIEKNFKENIYSYSFHYYNYSYFPKELNNHFEIFYACKYDYYLIVEDLIKTKRIDLEEKIVYNYNN